MDTKDLKSRISEFLRKNSTAIFCVICFLVTWFCLFSFLFPLDARLKGHDAQYHYLRVEALKYNVENHEVFSGVDYLFFGGGGYAGFAYPDIFLYIPAFLRVMGVGVGESMAFFLGSCNMLSYLFMFIFLKKLSGSPVCATTGAVLYVLSSYRIDNIITRFALGEVQAYVFWPLILYGLYDFIFDDFKKPYIIGFGFLGMVLSHTISTALALGLCVVISLIFIKRIFADPKKLLTLAAAAGCVAAVSAYYWIPLLELLGSCEMSVKRSAYNTVNNAIPFTALFRDLMDGGGVAGMKFPVFLMCVPRVFLTRNSPITKMYLQDEETKKRKVVMVIADTFLIVGLVLALMSTKLTPWKILSEFIDFIQFPWRLFAPASILLIIAGTIYIFYIAEYTKAPKIVMALVTAIAVLAAFVHADVSVIEHSEPYTSDHYSNVSETFTVGSAEWLPLAGRDTIKDALKKMKDNVLLSSGVPLPCERKGGHLEFDLGGNEGADNVLLPYVWYKGYEAKDENGKELRVSMSEIGLVQLELRGAAGRITADHKPTRIRIVSYFVSAASVVSLAAAAIIHKKKKRRKTVDSVQ